MSDYGDALRGVFYLAYVGITAIVAAVLIGGSMGVWWLFHHVSII
jgi:hypothetical protein